MKERFVRMNKTVQEFRLTFQKPIIIDSQPLPMVPPATPLNQSTSRLSSARSQRGEKPAAPLPEPVIGTPPIITGKLLI